MTEYKYVTWRNLHPGQEISGYKIGNSTCSFRAYVKHASRASVIVEMWRVGGELENIDADAMFAIEMTREEVEAKYFDKAKELLNNIQTKLHRDEIGPHDMWNAWLNIDPYEMAQMCSRFNLTVLGHCTDIVPKTSWIAADVLDIGVCVEDYDGDRFWCHWKKDYIDMMIEDFQEVSDD